MLKVCFWLCTFFCSHSPGLWIQFLFGWLLKLSSGIVLQWSAAPALTTATVQTLQGWFLQLVAVLLCASSHSPSVISDSSVCQRQGESVDGYLFGFLCDHVVNWRLATRCDRDQIGSGNLSDPQIDRWFCLQRFTVNWSVWLLKGTVCNF